MRVQCMPSYSGIAYHCEVRLYILGNKMNSDFSLMSIACV